MGINKVGSSRLDLDHLAIVGGGLVGLSAAIALSPHYKKVTLLDSGSVPLQTDLKAIGLNARSIALSASSVKIFSALGLWPRLSNYACPIKHIHVSNAGKFGVARLHASDNTLDAMGYVAEHDNLLTVLDEVCVATPTIEIIKGITIEDLAINGNNAQIDFYHLGQMNGIKAGTVIIADGANSNSRRLAGVDHKNVEYDQAAVICNVRVSKPGNCWAYERFTDSGPLAFLPLSENVYAVVWTCGPQQMEALLKKDDDSFISALQEIFGYRLGYIEAVGHRFGFPVVRTQSHQLVKSNLVLMGNAANALHPVAGQGFNLALRDIAKLKELVREHVEGVSIQPTMTSLLDAYQSSRSREQEKVIKMGDGLVSLFSNQLPVLDHMRGVGLAVLDLLPAVKRDVSLTGMGLAFSGNRLLRGDANDDLR